MDVKHQVFVSSTYLDLVEERKSVIHALLELDCIPSGMELFPAADEDAWSLIKEIIDGCDYYILILAGKYGSTNIDGIGYTEMEFDYALSTNKPIICFMHENIDTLTSDKCEKSEALQTKLKQFKEKALTKHCKYWSNAEDLGGKVSRGLISLRKRHPSLGWVPGKYAASDIMLRELQELRSKVAQLELEATLNSRSAPPDIENLSKGSDAVPLVLNLRHSSAQTRKQTKIECTWDHLLSYFGPSMLNECTISEMMKRVALAYYHGIPDNIRKYNDSFDDLVIPYVLEDKILVQFQALGIIEQGIKKRALSDNANYWKLTPYGEKYLLNVRAERRK